MSDNVILFSGGLDSTALRYMYPDSLLLYVDMNTRYSEQEKTHLPKETIIVPFPLGQWEQNDFVIPMRNLYLVTIASNYADNVLIGATAGDMLLDKSQKFMDKMSDVLSFLWSEDRYKKGRPREIKVQAPLKLYSKTQIIKLCKDLGFAEKVIQDSFSCYSPINRNEVCGECRICVRNWIACELNDISLSHREKSIGAFVQNIEHWKNDLNRRHEDNEFNKICNKIGITL